MPRAPRDPSFSASPVLTLKVCANIPGFPIHPSQKQMWALTLAECILCANSSVSVRMTPRGPAGESDDTSSVYSSCYKRGSQGPLRSLRQTCVAYERILRTTHFPKNFNELFTFFSSFVSLTVSSIYITFSHFHLLINPLSSTSLS